MFNLTMPHSPNQRRALLRAITSSCALLLIVGGGADTFGSAQNAEPLARGVIVETAPDRPGGLAAGDILYTWVRAPRPPSHPVGAEGQINSPFDLYTVEREHASRGVVTLHGRRGEAVIAVPMPSAESTLPLLDWRVSVRPQMSPARLAAYREGVALVAAKRPLDAAARWKQLAVEADTEQSDLAAWLFYAGGNVLSDARLVPDAIAFYGEAERRVTTRKTPVVAAFIANVAGRRLEDSGDAAGASESNARAMKLLSPMGDSLFLSRVLLDLGSIAHARGDLRRAEQAFEEVVRIREELSPASRGLATALNNLGAVAQETGAPARAHVLNRRALEILERLIPGSLQVSTVLNNAGKAAADAGDLEAAEDLFRRALAIRERLEPGGRAVALSLLNLGGVSKRRGDLATAHDLYSRALEIFVRVAPESAETVGALQNLAAVAFAQGDLAEDESLLRRALGIAERTAPGTLRVAGVLHNLGVLAHERKDLAQSTELVRRALDIAEKAAPRGRESGLYLDSLGWVTEERGDLKEAEHLYRRALSIWQAIAPGGDGETRASYHLAALMRRTGRLRESASFFESAVAALESSAGRLGGDDETRSRFSAERGEIYADYIDLLHQLQEDPRAFHLVERSRAASLLRMLAERDILSGDLPADLVSKRRQLNAEYDRVQGRMSTLDPVTEAAALQQAATRLRELRAEREQLIQQIRKASARTAAVQYPQPLALEAVRDTLDAGTVLLSYSVGTERTLLFVVQSGTTRAAALQVFTVPITSADLRREVAQFRSTIERRLLDPHVAAGRRLYDLLIAPADGLIAPSQRVLIAPDGPLHSLPFAALVRPDDDRKAAARSRTPLYFIAWKPLHVTVSATVYAEVKRAPRRATDRKTVVAFGDPVLPVSSSIEADRGRDPGLPALLRRGSQLESLPSSRREVAQITALYPASASGYLAGDATEERVKEVAGRARYLHFATHGLLDERFPLDSGLVLTRTPGAAGQTGENGLLQAWEIFDHVRLNADLVVLSACETALGAELGGEGLVGLSRAFQYAGARSVLASLWSVADESTADLMYRFYRHIKAGHPKDVALQRAQRELLRSAPTAHPFHWAAFTLSGDWQDGPRR